MMGKKFFGFNSTIFRLSFFPVLITLFLLSSPLFSQDNTPNFFSLVPPKPGSPAAEVKPIPHPPGPPPWAKKPIDTTTPDMVSPYPTQGLNSIVTLAVDFKDNAAKTNLNRYDDLLFDTPGYSDNITKSLKKYYREVSYSALDVAGEVYGKTKSSPTAWVKWVRTPSRYSTYSVNNGFGSYPRNAQKLTEDTVKAVDSYVNFGKYTLYKGTEAGVTGWFVSSLAVVHAGPGGEVTGRSEDIWSHSWVTRTPIRTNDLASDGKPVYVYRYIMMAEDSPMGIFGHEYGHALGLPDLYDYDGSSYGIGLWSMMAYGSWNDDGNTPAQIDAFCKIQAGWVTPTIVGNTTNINIPSVEANPVVYRLSTSQAQEYFLVENRQRTLFDTNIPGDGLLIWHVDDAVTNNNNENHFHVALEQADGLRQLETRANYGDTGDPYPGTTLNRTFADTTNPNSKSYTGVLTGVAATQVSDSSATMTVTLTGGLP